MGRPLLLLLKRLPLLELELELELGLPPEPGLSSSLVLALRTPIALLGAVGLRAGNVKVSLSHRNGMDVDLAMRSPTTTRRKHSRDDNWEGGVLRTCKEKRTKRWIMVTLCSSLCNFRAVYPTTNERTCNRNDFLNFVTLETVSSPNATQYTSGIDTQSLTPSLLI
jgi:hypothetical protein